MRKCILVLAVTSLFFHVSSHAQDQSAGETAPATPPAPPVEVVPAETMTEAERLAKEHILRKEAEIAGATALINEGLEMAKAGNPQEAIKKLNDGLSKLPSDIPMAHDARKRATKGLTDAYLAIGETELKAGNFDKAREAGKTAGELDPTSKAPEKFLARVEAEAIKPKRIVAEDDPEFVKTKQLIARLFREGRVFLESGQYDKAQETYQQILLLDHDNLDAHSWLQKLSKERRRIADHMADKRRDQWLWAVTDAWFPPVPGGIEPPEKPELARTISTEEAKKLQIRKKLQEIKIPDINIEKGYIQNVVDYLRQQSKERDPSGVGVNILMGGGLSQTPPPSTPDTVPVVPAPGGEGGDVPAAPAVPTDPPASQYGQLIFVNLSNATLGEALTLVTKVAGLKYVIDGNAVLIVPLDYVSPQEMVTKVYPVANTAQFREKLVLPSSASSGGGDGVGDIVGMGTDSLPTANVIDVKAYFEQSGVAFPPGSSLTYSEQTGRIIVRNTPEQLETFESILEFINIIPPQVEIETKFMEVSQADLDELGFEWFVGNQVLGDFDFEGGSPSQTFPPGSGQNDANSDVITGGLRDSTILQANAIEALLAAQGFGTAGSVANNLATFRGVLTNPQFTVVIKALSQKRSSDLLSAPRITTISGSQAQIRIVQEFIYPTEFDPPEVVAAGGGTTGGGAVGITPSNPSAFRTREIGVLLNVTPTVGADGYTINLTVIPEVSEFLGFINYGGPIALSAGNNILTAQNDIRQPLFASRNLTTSVVIWDGQTLVLGGLLREDISKIHDKVPFLGDIPFVGRLFQSKVTQRTKRNLMIFVTAKLIKPDGTLLNPPDKNIFRDGASIRVPAPVPPPTTPPSLVPSTPELDIDPLP